MLNYWLDTYKKKKLNMINYIEIAKQFGIKATHN